MPFESVKKLADAGAEETRGDQHEEHGGRREEAREAELTAAAEDCPAEGRRRLLTYTLTHAHLSPFVNIFGRSSRAASASRA